MCVYMCALCVRVYVFVFVHVLVVCVYMWVFLCMRVCVSVCPHAQADVTNAQLGGRRPRTWAPAAQQRSRVSTKQHKTSAISIRQALVGQRGPGPLLERAVL